MPQLSDFELDIQTKLLRATFLTNMAVMKKFMPEIFEFYQNYTPSRAKLTFDHNGEVNIVSNGALIYEEHAKENSYKQADLYLKQPKLFSYQLTRAMNFMFQHEHKLNDLYLKREAEVKDIYFNLIECGEQIDLISVIGMGLGYHVERLFERADIRYLFIHEPDPDVFYCAMHCIDLGPMINKCFSLGGTLTIKIGGNANQFANEVASVLSTQGAFNVCRLFLYRHYHSDTTDETFQKIHELAYRLSDGWGFFEDEVISVAHTLSNIAQGYPLLLNKSLFDNKLKNKPVFIVGNGPSLDADIEYLQNNQDMGIIFSCGTALCSLLHSGITPDFHIEMERTKMVYDWIIPIGMEDKLKEINIIALNTVHTDALKLFKNAYLLPKPKDAGMDFLYQFIDEEKFTPIMCSNPTVTNAATAAAAYMGFKTLYLFGVDYGYKNVNEHHAKGSLYYKKDFVGFTEKMSGDFQVKGNFCDEVYTSQVFDSSKGVLEILLESNPDVTCYNCSDGAMVELTKPLKSADIEILESIMDKSALVEVLLRDAFHNEELGSKDYYKVFIKQLPKLKTIIEQVIAITSIKIKDRKHLAQIFSEQYKHVKSFEGRRDTELYFRILRGTLNYFQANIMTNVYLYRDKDQQSEYIDFSLNLLHEHLLWLYDHMLVNYNQLSDL